MNLIQTTLIHKVLQPKKKSSGKSPTLILLHGRGANEDDLLGLAEYLDERLLLISARAPFAFQYGGGFTWYEIEEVGKPEPKMFAESYSKLSQFFDDVKGAYPVDPARVIFCGFSMGTMMSYSIALTKPEAIVGVIANSGYVPEDTELQFQWDKVKGKPFLVSHGLYDPVIPVAFGRRAKELLNNAHASVTYREYEMGHQISEESLNDMMQWLTKHI
ncbi:MAG: alpha/beta hydrolase [Ignavibacteria bacterium]|nr:alpha/beta hydrolase [Ignavibacteria bacterium]